ncbi:aldehyde dehydrogenase (NADP(+)) [Paraflavisolibacter sp. H34]|uniref:aldehyde dehydrogenase (NADP(+)) n=1 Tax=Huijunlia imazamoxiresistens TaxID=3127457 RepID=UPI003016F4BA
MYSGHNLTGAAAGTESTRRLQVFSTATQQLLPETYPVATAEEIEAAVAKATAAFEPYRHTTFEQRAVFLETIAEEIWAIGAVLVQRAALESGLPEARLTGERARTMGQLRLFADLLREGSWTEAVIDTALPDRQPLPRADLRKTLLPLGPVAVFGASNFPLAFSTAGGDTASALAAGCPVIVKAHEAHLGTNELVTRAVLRAVQKCGMPEGVFASLVGEGAELGQALARHPGIKAIGFTGSFRAGMALYKTATSDRSEPIPVYAEMSSINPVLLLPQKLAEAGEQVARQLAGSITLGAGQFCTNPGLLLLPESAAAQTFLHTLAGLLEAAPETTMLHAGICNSYYTGREELQQQPGVTSLVPGGDARASYKATAALLQVRAADFIANPVLQHEVFGPSSLVVTCRDRSELLQVLQALGGQLTGTVMGTPADLEEYAGCIDALTGKVGRLLFNGVPTGVEVCHAMVHGGPFPATTDARSTSVGAEAIRRFVRPVCYQDCPEALLPDALKNSNPLGLLRKVNGRWTREALGQEELVNSLIG